MQLRWCWIRFYREWQRARGGREGLGWERRFSCSGLTLYIKHSGRALAVETDLATKLRGSQGPRGIDASEFVYEM